MTKIQTHPSTIVYGFAASGIIETVRKGIINVKSELGVEEHVIQVGDDPLELAQTWLSRWLVSATGLPTLNRTAKYVAEGIRSRIDIHPQAELSLIAPRSYRLIRDNARRKKR